MTDEEGRRIEKLDPEIIKAEISEVLFKAFGKNKQKADFRPVDIHVT